MPTVKELYGLPIGEGGDRREIIRQAHCPHMMAQCDGGGNRDMARLPANDQTMAELFDPAVGSLSGGFIPCGVCSIHVASSRESDTGVDWAVCPRRILTFQNGGFSVSQTPLAQRSLQLGGFQKGDRVSVWSEVRIIDRQLGIDYRFDYILRKEDTPPILIEIMASSTSGGNRRKRTDIQSTFLNAVLYEFGIAQRLGQSPTVNARQVWARMMSQMIVKSEIMNSWGGRAIWIVQDSLKDYISRSTGLDLNALHSENWQTGEVNLVSVNINDPHDLNLYSGPIRPRSNSEAFWLELPTAPALPDISRLEASLANRDPVVTFVA